MYEKAARRKHARLLGSGAVHLGSAGIRYESRRDGEEDASFHVRLATKTDLRTLSHAHTDEAPTMTEAA
jgi:hypothetical protein